MSGVNRMTGTPWHTDVLKKKESDERRHKCRCMYYNKKSDYCHNRKMRCMGSAHCKYYKELQPSSKSTTYVSHQVNSATKTTANLKNDGKVTKRVDTTNTCKSRIQTSEIGIDYAKKKETDTIPFKAIPFSGIKMVPINSVMLGSRHFSKASTEEINVIVDYYHKYHEMQLPVVVSCNSGKYLIEDNYHTFYVAKLMGHSEVPARIGTYQDNSIYDTIRKEGQRIRHTQYGKGTVMSATLKSVSIKFDGGQIVNFNIEILIEDGAIFAI